MPVPLRFLIVTTPFAGHLVPTVPVGSELIERGHDVTWCTFEEPLRRFVPDAERRHALDSPVDAAHVERLAERVRAVRGFAGFKVMWQEVFVPLGEAMAPGVDRAISELAPDVFVADQLALGAALVARRRRLRWATSAASPVTRERALAGLPKVLAWTDELLAGLQRKHGLEPVRGFEDSPELVVMYASTSLAGPAESFPPQYRFVGVPQGRRADVGDFPFDALREGHRVLVSLGSVNAERGQRFFDTLKQALCDLPLQVILVAPQRFGPFPDNFLVRPWVPQLALLPEVDALVGHGGHNTVSEALAAGKPLVLLPITDDQPMVAQLVVETGCGLRLPFARVRPAALREAVLRVLVEPAFREAAERQRRAFAAAGGTARAADLLEAFGRGEPV